jgi:hypothetical protein
VEIAERAREVVRIRSCLVVGDPNVAEGGFVLKSELFRSELGESH